MRLEPSAEHQQIREVIRDLVKADVAPGARAWDSEGELPASLLGSLAELGMFGVLVAEDEGGTGLDLATLAVILEELGRGDGSVALTVAVHNTLAAGFVAAAGSGEQRAEWLPRLASGEWLGSHPLDGGWSGTHATAADDGSWLLDGVARHVPQGRLAGLVVVPVDGAAFGVGQDTSGVDVIRHRDNLGMRAADLSNVEIAGCRLTDEARMPLDGGGGSAERVLDGARVALAAVALGLGRGGLEEAARYALEREAFGRPIADFQAIQHKLADMACALDAARLLVQRAATLHDGGRRCRKEAAMARLAACESALAACDQAIQVFGGYGFTRDFPVERFWRDARVCSLALGDGATQRDLIAAEHR